MRIAILLSGSIAAVLFILSGISFFAGWENFKSLALTFIASAIVMFVLMIIRNVREGWEPGSFKHKEDK